LRIERQTLAVEIMGLSLGANKLDVMPNRSIRSIILPNGAKSGAKGSANILFD